MEIKKYLNILTEQKPILKTQLKLINFLKNNPSPNIKDIHDFNIELNMDELKIQEMIYELLGSFFGAGLSEKFSGLYNIEELKMGIKVEMEHTSNFLISQKIAKDHLAECSDYYTLLEKMEKNCKEPKK